jgi:hypothetical protein
MSFLYLFICLALFAIGDILGVFTKAKLSSVFVALMLFLIGFMTGVLPPDIIEQAGLSQISKWATAYLVFHMGTMINWSQLIREWRSVVVSIIAMGIAVIALFAVVPIIGKEAAIVSIPVINGGIVATQIMTAAAMEKGLTIAAALGTIVYSIQKFVGTPPGSYHGLKEARKVLEEYRANKASAELNGETAASIEKAAVAATKTNKAKVMFYQKYEKYFTDFTCLGVSGLFAWLSQVLGKATPINYSIWALVLGATVGYIGLVPPKILEKGKASGLLQMALFASIIPSLATISLSDLVTLGWQTFVVFAAVIGATYLVVYFTPVWKIVGSKDLSIGIAMAQLLGFPATLLVSNEIATAIAETPEEKEVVLNRIMPAYVVAGFVSVTSLSIIIAGIFIKFL